MSKRPSTGKVCACGKPKSLQARICQSCRTLEKRDGLTLRQQQRKWYGFTTPLAVGEYDPAYHHEQLALTVATLDGELALLVAEQQKDDKRRQISWDVSLDSTDRYGRPMYELVEG